MDVENVITQKRLAIAGKPGIAGLVGNWRTFAMAIFASLGGLIYGFNQGMFGQILSMYSFGKVIGTDSIADDPVLQGLLTSILELGAWVGCLANGYLADKFGRKNTVAIAVFFFTIGVIVQAVAHGGNYNYILGGRFVIGIGVGSLSMIVPLYNAELSPPEIRGSLVAMQQLSITFGIMIAYWITYGTNYIGGTGETQSNAAWLIPICIQLVPAFILVAGFYLFMPASPRWLIQVGREDEALKVLAGLRRLPETEELVQMEYLEVIAQHKFEQEIARRNFPDLQGDDFASRFKLGFAEYKVMFTHRPTFKRVRVAVLIMLIQQWTGVNFVLYYSPFIFQSLGLTGGTTSLLASGVVGVVMFLATIPAVLWVDQVGRKPVLISGALLMGMCHFIIAGINGGFHANFKGHEGAGWAAVVFVWLFAIFFGYSWGPCSWVLVAEVFPLGTRARGISIGASSNWANNFAVAMATPKFMAATKNYGAYIFLGMMCIIGALYVYFLTPETKGKTLEEIDKEFGDTSGTAKQEKELYLRIVEEVGLFELANIHGDGEKVLNKQNVSHAEYNDKQSTEV
ncbi:hypothetical protein TRICI_005536 [Trichomonascus ciferrii]|uniref:Major facilitator superfamily (MFS) profile domain-containing protein n=1 Tax=Trichomonascus ciferrii TaxID=44093 RepID=A0A642URS1_9ASCO|nr:hypothetical protein TRICI_005536 [Trichomonascus ciferrii]